jgi:hypothetical protein
MYNETTGGKFKVATPQRADLEPPCHCVLGLKEMKGHFSTGS